MTADTRLDQVYARNPNMISRKIIDEFLLVPILKKVEDVSCIYTLNEVGARIWELLDGSRTVATVRDEIVREFDAGPDVVEADLLDLIQQLEQVGAIKET